MIRAFSLALLPLATLAVFEAGSRGVTNIKPDAKGLEIPRRAVHIEGVGPAACQRPYSAYSPWNRPIGPKPVYDSRSDFHLRALQGTLLSDPGQYTFPVYEVANSAPLQTVTISGWYSHVFDAGRRLRSQRGGTIRLPIPANARPGLGTDAQVILLNPFTGDEWGLWRLRQGAKGGWTATNAYRYNIRWDGVPPRDSSGRPFVSRGAGIPYLAGLVRPCEIARGRIEHALAFAYDYPVDSYVYPATKSDGIGANPADLPEGARLQLDPSLTEAQIRAWGCRGPCLTIARALQDYGMYVVDNSRRAKVMVEYEGTASWRGILAAETVGPIPLAAFKLLLLGSRQR